MQDKTNIRQNQRQGVYILCCFALSLFGCLAGPDGELGQLEEEIINPDPSGNAPAQTDAVIIRRPVAVGSPTGTLGNGFCTGTRIGGGRLLTAAHCLAPETDSVQARLGSKRESVTHVSSMARLGSNNYAMSGWASGSGFVDIGNLFGTVIAPPPPIPTPTSVNLGNAKVTELIVHNGRLYGAGWTRSANIKRAVLFKFTSIDGNIGTSIVELDAPGTEATAITQYERGGIPRFAIAIESTNAGVVYGKVVDIDVTMIGGAQDVYPDTAALKISELEAGTDGSLAIGATKINPYFDTLMFVRCRHTSSWDCVEDEYDEGLSDNVLEDMSIIGNDIVALVKTGSNQSVIRRTPSKSFSLDDIDLNSHWSFAEIEGSKTFHASSIDVSGTGENAKIYIGGYVKHSTFNSSTLLALNYDLQLDTTFSAFGILPGSLDGDDMINALGPLLAEAGEVNLAMFRTKRPKVGPARIVYDHTVLSYHGPLAAELDGAPLLDYRFAPGFDLVVATYTNSLPSPTEPSFPGFSAPPDGPTFQCIGYGGTATTVLRQGAFSMVDSIFNFTSGRVNIESKAGHKITGGDSGGPCFDSSGNLVGVLSSTYGNAASLGEMVSGSTAEEFVNSLSSQP